MTHRAAVRGWSGSSVGHRTMRPTERRAFQPIKITCAQLPRTDRSPQRSHNPSFRLPCCGIVARPLSSVVIFRVESTYCRHAWSPATPRKVSDSSTVAANSARPTFTMVTFADPGISLLDAACPGFPPTVDTGSISRKNLGVPPIRAMIALDSAIEPAAFVRSCRNWGIEMPILDPSFFQDMRMAGAIEAEGLTPWLNLPVFHRPQYLQSHPECYAITSQGRKAVTDWLHFACPSLGSEVVDLDRDAVGLAADKPGSLRARRHLKLGPDEPFHFFGPSAAETTKMAPSI